MTLHRVLVVDPDRASRDALVASVKSLGLRVIEAPSPRRLSELLASTPPDVVLLDPRIDEAPGLDLVERIRERHPGLPLVLLGDPASDPRRNGGEEWLARSSGPAEIERLLERVERGLRLREENDYLRGELLGGEREPLIARSAAMADALRAAARYARSRAPVLITGEPGTGRRRLARYVHAHSSRGARAVVRAQCAELEPSELERRLFGESEGHAHSPALLEIAAGGTLLLEEVGELAGQVQERLAAVLRAGFLKPRDAARSVGIDVRLIVTGRSAPSAMAGDALGLASALRIELLPLRERAEDVLPLAEHFANAAARELGRAPVELTEEARQQLLAWSWPGNVRELEYVVRRGALLARGRSLDSSAFGFSLRAGESKANGADPEANLARQLADMPIAEVERIAILATLDSAGGNKTEAARRLGLTARTLSNKLKLWRTQGLVT